MMPAGPGAFQVTSTTVSSFRVKLHHDASLSDHRSISLELVNASVERIQSCRPGIPEGPPTSRSESTTISRSPHDSGVRLPSRRSRGNAAASVEIPRVSLPDAGLK